MEKAVASEGRACAQLSQVQDRVPNAEHQHMGSRCRGSRRD